VERPAGGTRVRVRFVEMSADRRAVARVSAWAVAVSDAVPGDVADIEIRERRAAGYRGRLIAVVHPSARRVQPLCPHFEQCGGCQWQRLDGAAQVEHKVGLARRALAAAGAGDLPISIVPAPAGWAYRTAGSYVPSVDRHGPALGLHAANGPSNIPIRTCLVQSPLLETAFEEMRRAWRVLAFELGGRLCREVRLRVGEASREVGVGLVMHGALTESQRGAIVETVGTHVKRVVEIAAVPARDVSATVGPMTQLRHGRRGIVELLHDCWYHVPVFAPFPAAGRASAAAVAHAVQALDLDHDVTVVETDAGIGAYTLPVAAAAGRVIGRTAGEHLEAARENAALNNESRAVFVDRKAETLARLARTYGPIRRALVQADYETAPFETLAGAGVRRLIVLAGSPGKLAHAVVAARDAGFTPRSVTLIDTHPQTSRAELHAVLDGP
jgi:23S rRNA (uracil1939-C5)-methyltransferase